MVFDQISLGTNPTGNTSNPFSLSTIGITPTGTIPNTSSNPFNLPDDVIAGIENVVNGINENIDFDLDDIPQSLVNSIDNFFGDNGAPAEVLDHLGLNTDFEVINIPQAVASWGVNGEIGGVDFSIGSSDDEQPNTSGSKGFTYYLKR